jgi:hypothetical protein
MPRGFAAHPELINRNGRPKKGQTLTDLLEKELKKKSVKLDIGNGQSKLISGKEAVSRALVQLALNEKNFPAIKYIIDRIDGAPRQDVSLGSHSLSDETKKRMMDIFQEAMDDQVLPEIVKEKGEWDDGESDALG